MKRDREQLPTGGSSQEFVPYNRWLHQHDEDIRKDFPERLTEDLAGEYDVSYYTVSRRATRLGVAKSDEFMRTHWASGDHNRKRKYKGSTDEYMKAHFHDTSNAELSALFGVDVKTVRRWARRLGLQKSDEFMFKSRSSGSKGYYTDEHKAWRNKRIAEVYPDADEEGLQRLADELGVKRSSLEKLVVKLGVKRSPQRVAEAKQRGWDKKRRYSRELIAAVAEYYPYHSTEECAEKFGINLGTLNQIATHSGWKKDKAYRSRMTSEMLRRRHREKNNK